MSRPETTPCCNAVFSAPRVPMKEERTICNRCGWVYLSDGTPDGKWREVQFDDNGQVKPLRDPRTITA